MEIENENNSILLKNKFQDIFLKSFKKDRICFNPGCKEIAINSHILSKNGIIRSISQNKHLYLVDNSRYLFQQKLRFNKIGINDALTFKGFCQKHDNEIFRSIEQNSDINFSNYSTQLLLSYRGILNELRKKEILIDVYNTMRKNEEVYLKLELQIFEEFYTGLKIGLKDLETYKSFIEKMMK